MRHSLACTRLACRNTPRPTQFVQASAAGRRARWMRRAQLGFEFRRSVCRQPAENRAIVASPGTLAELCTARASRRLPPRRESAPRRPRRLACGAERDVLPRCGDLDGHAEHERCDGPHGLGLRAAADQERPLERDARDRSASSPAPSPESMPSTAARARFSRVVEARVIPVRDAVASGRFGVRSPSK